MSDARDVYGTERQVLDALISMPHDDDRLYFVMAVKSGNRPNANDTTKVYYYSEDSTYLRRGWYEHCGGVVLHWTNRADLVREISALLSWTKEV